MYLQQSEFYEFLKERDSKLLEEFDEDDTDVSAHILNAIIFLYLG